MKVLVVNCGSSSIKYRLYDMASESELARGLLERIGEPGSQIHHEWNGQRVDLTDEIADYEAGVQRIVQLLTGQGTPPPLAGPDELDGVGHRVVHGAEDFYESVIVDDRVVAAIEKCCELAPLHNPANLAGLQAAMKILPGKPQVAVFDTAFFQTMPPQAYLYAVPYEWYERYRIRRYGFHGTSHRYVCMQAAELLGIEAPNLISLHLGNGCSMTCVRAGKAIDQSMGLTPLEGLVMGTRSGDIDPAIIFHLVRMGLSIEQIREQLEKKSGLLGISGVSRDLRDVVRAAEQGNERAALALDVFAHRARKYVGAYLAELGRCDAIILTGGIGENSALMRSKILSGLDPLGIELDPSANEQPCDGAFCISTQASRTAVWVVPTNEELMIARDTARLVRQAAQACP